MAAAAHDAIRSLIDQLDEVCRESEWTRLRAEQLMRQSPHWPERRQPSHWTRSSEDGSPDSGRSD